MPIPNTSSWLLWLDPRSLFYQQGLEIQAVRKDVISDIVTPHAEMVQSHWVLPLQCQLHGLQMCVHTYIHTCNQPIYLPIRMVVTSQTWIHISSIINFTSSRQNLLPWLHAMTKYKLITRRSQISCRYYKKIKEARRKQKYNDKIPHIPQN